MSQETQLKAFNYFSARWASVPMGHADFIERQWKRTIEQTNEQFPGYGDAAAKAWQDAAAERLRFNRDPRP